MIKNSRMVLTKFTSYIEVLYTWSVRKKNMNMSAKTVRKEMDDVVVLRHTKGKKTTISSVVPATVSLQVLGTGANGSPSSVYIFTENARYLFNCGEGLQRLAYEHKIKISRLEHIFFSRNRWSMAGGLPGLALTLQDAGVQQVNLHGPPHLDRILRSMKMFVVLKKMQVKTIDCTECHDYEDHVMKIKSICLSRNENLGKSRRGDEVILYICKLKAKPGALNLQKCVDYGVPPGPLLGKLKNGIDVTLDNGTVVKSSDVSESPEKPSTFIILDVPEVEYLPALKSKSNVFKELHSGSDHNVVCVLHFTPPEIVQNEEYKEFMKEHFTIETQHLYLNVPDKGYSGFTSAHRIQYKLNLLDSKIFPLLNETDNLNCQNHISMNLKKIKFNEATQTDLLDSSNGDCTKTLYPLASYFVRPPKGLVETNSARIYPEEYLNETNLIKEFMTELQKLKTNPIPHTPGKREDIYPKILFTGTGSCIPNKSRNVSGILVEVQSDSYILLDCGEGTLGQIVRFYGTNKAAEVLRNLKAIYISHLHADHHIGLVAVLAERRRLQASQNLLLFAPAQIQDWLDFYNSEIENINIFELIPNGKLLNQNLELHQTHPYLGITSIRTCLVRHCPHAFGVSFTIPGLPQKEPVKVTYSGDSMPCQDLVELGKGTTVLIHEATMEDDLVEEAREKLHSTTSEAIQQGRDMGAKYTILTHFSQRYAKLPRLQNLSDDIDCKELRNVAIAFDNMQVTLDDLEHFHRLYPALQALFAEYTDELDQKALKRTMKMERKRKLNIENV